MLRGFCLYLRNECKDYLIIGSMLSYLLKEGVTQIAVSAVSAVDSTSNESRKNYNTVVSDNDEY